MTLEFSDLFRLAENACAHRYGKHNFDARGNRSHNLAIWSRMRYQCATTSKLTSLVWSELWFAFAGSSSRFFEINKSNLWTARRMIPSCCSWEYSQLHLSYSWEFLKLFVPELGKLEALYGRGGGLGGQDRPRRLEPYGNMGAQHITSKLALVIPSCSSWE